MSNREQGSPERQSMCSDCAGLDIEWMRSCHKHKGVQFCDAMLKAREASSD